MHLKYLPKKYYYGHKGLQVLLRIVYVYLERCSNPHCQSRCEQVTHLKHTTWSSYTRRWECTAYNECKEYKTIMICMFLQQITRQLRTELHKHLKSHWERYRIQSNEVPFSDL